MLCIAGADLTLINAKGQEPAHLAVMRNHVDVIKFLFSKSINLESQCFQGKQPLHYAAQHGGMPIVIFFPNLFLDSGRRFCQLLELW